MDRLVDAGFEAAQIGLWVGTWGMVFSLAGSLAGGLLASRVSLLSGFVAERLGYAGVLGLGAALAVAFLALLLPLRSQGVVRRDSGPV